jgi:hypothetical protein
LPFLTATLPLHHRNDPNAPFEHRGIFHLFYQYNPLSASWDAPYWGHVASNDLVHWQQLPEALAPDAHYDSDGVFSGSATLLKNGTPAILYTGARGDICSVSGLCCVAAMHTGGLVWLPLRPLLLLWGVHDCAHSNHITAATPTAILQTS